MTRGLIRAVVVALLLLPGGASGGASAEPSDLEEAAGVLAPFKRDLMQALQDGLAQGPVEAIGACQLRAPEIADERSRDGVRVGRTSHRLRNPENAAPDWVAPLLEAYVGNPADRAPRLVPLPGERAGYVEPIGVKPLCLTCHGETLAPAVAERITALYPDDRATGFAVGDLRGLFWLEFRPSR